MYGRGYRHAQTPIQRAKAKDEVCNICAGFTPLRSISFSFLLALRFICTVCDAFQSTTLARPGSSIGFRIPSARFLPTGALGLLGYDRGIEAGVNL